MLSTRIIQSLRALLTPTALLFTLLSALMSGCGTQQVRTDSGTTPIQAQKPTPEMANQLLASGDTAQAAHIYAQLASTETDPQRQQELQLLATELYFDSELYNDGARLFSALPATMSIQPLQQRRDIAEAYYLIAQRQPQEALQRLPQLRALTDSISRNRSLEIQARAHELLGQPAKSLKARIQIEANLTIPQSVNLNHTRIWQMLSSLDSESLQHMTKTPGGTTYRGWLEYTMLARSEKSLTPEIYAQRSALWQSRYNGHPAAAVAQGGFADDTVQTATRTSINPSQIALLLPLTGQFSEIGAAIKSGFIAARFTDGAATSVKLYDTKSNAGHAVEQYQLATSEGASLVIGPLNKSAVINLAANNLIAVPTLSLNYVGDNLPGHANLYQFGLLPEDEARDAAHYAKNEKHNKALIFASDSVIGQRMADAFSATFSANGGQVIGTESIPEDAYDYSRQLTKLLAINSSHSRKRNLEKLLDTNLEFEPAIRADIDVIFMAVNSEHARLLKPQLKFHHAGDVPVLSTSMVFSGKTDEKADSDLTGVRFNEIPWLLTDATSNSSLYSEMTKSQPTASAGISRLMALGIDAYNLHKEIENMRLDELYSVNGKTGALSLALGNRIQRRLQWAEFQKGAPTKISDALPVTATLPPLPSTEL